MIIPTPLLAYYQDGTTDRRHRRNPSVTGNVVIDPECLTEEELNLVIDQMTAASFNFIAPDLTESGVYRVDVLAWLDTGASFENGSAEGKATVGLGSMSVPYEPRDRPVNALYRGGEFAGYAADAA